MVNYFENRSSLFCIIPTICASVGAGALIPYKRGDDDVGWFISYRPWLTRREPNQGISAISTIPMETINLLLARMVGMMQKFDDRLSAVRTIQHQMSSAMEDTIRLSGNWMRGLGE